MLTIRPFKNTDPAAVLNLWNENAQATPCQYFPLQNDILESQVFGNILFDREGFFIAIQDGVPVGCIHAAFGSDTMGTGISSQCGVIYPPLLKPGVENAFELGRELILKAEQYLVQRGSVRWFAGGTGKLSPFYTGLYGRTNPFGIFENDDFTLDLFQKLNYDVFCRSSRLSLDVSKYQPPVSQSLLEMHRKISVQRNRHWIPRNWWDANIYRNFSSYEWNVFIRDDDNSPAIAGAVIHQMMTTSVFLQNQFCILAYIGVLENSLRCGIASVLFTSLINDLQYESFLPLIMETTVTNENEPLLKFLHYHSFQRIGGYVSFCKTLNSK